MSVVTGGRPSSAFNCDSLKTHFRIQLHSPTGTKRLRQGNTHGDYRHDQVS